MTFTRKPKLEVWLANKEDCKKDFEEYIKKSFVKKEVETKNLSLSHLKKTEHNMSFVNHLIEIKQFYDWIIVGCYVKKLDRKPHPLGCGGFLSIQNTSAFSNHTF